MAQHEQLQQNVLTTVGETQNLPEFLQTRPFAPVTKSHTGSSEQGTQPNLQAKSDRTSGFGHSFGNLAVQALTRPVIQPKLTIGQPGDKYEQEADRVAAEVVQRINQPEAVAPKQRETVQRQELPQQVIQCAKVETLKTSNAQTNAAKDHKVEAPKNKDKKDEGNFKPEKIKPKQHPMYASFQNRIKQVFSEFPPPKGYDIALLTENIWMNICEAIDASSPEMERKEGNTTYSNVEKGYVNMESPGYKKALSKFDMVMGTLKKVSESQFVKAKTFGFWSKPEGRALAEKMCDLTLETSGIGAIFDGFPSLNAHQNGWDAQLWGSLSRAFGEAVAVEMTKKGKSVHVFAGGGTEKTNIFGAVESKALEKGASAIGKTLEEAVTFHSVAAKSQKQREPDLTVHVGDLPGTWYSGNSWDTSLKIGKEKYDLLPKEVTV